MQPYIKIDGRSIGFDFDPVVIAELGINHGGDLEIAFQLVDAAARSGVEIIKHQTHIVEDEMSKSAKNIYPAHAKESIYDIMQKCALNEKDEIKLQEYVKSKGMIFISTPFSRAAADRLKKMDIPAFKIGSGECNNYPLIKHIASFGKPVILSTGMNTIESVSTSVNILKKAKVPYALLHTTNIYPTPEHLVRLGAITQLMKKFPSAVVGLSDHTTSNLACYSAVALGASILERHFTDTLDRIGPDISCSMDETACKTLINDVKKIRLMRGGIKEPALEEKPTIDFAFACVVTINDIKEGELFTHENLWVKRPGTGEIKAKDYENILGKKAKRNIPNDEMLKLDDIN